MSVRYASYGGMDTQFLSEGDYFFKGLDLKLDRDLLQQGHLAKSINKRLRTGVATTRPGTRLEMFGVSFFGNGFVGSMVFSNPNGYESLLVAEANRGFVWELRDGAAPQQIYIGGGGASLGTIPVWF